MPSEMTMLFGRPWWKRLLKSPRITALIHHRQTGRKATTSQQRCGKYPISILEEGNVLAISRSPRHRDQWKARGATTRLSSLYQVNDIALGTRIVWIMFIWPLSGLAHRSQITVLAYRKAWPVDRGKIEVDLWALQWWHGHRFENLKWTDGGTAGLSGSQPILSRRCW